MVLNLRGRPPIHWPGTLADLSHALLDLSLGSMATDPLDMVDPPRFNQTWLPTSLASSGLDFSFVRSCGENRKLLQLLSCGLWPVTPSSAPIQAPACCVSVVACDFCNQFPVGNSVYRSRQIEGVQAI